MPNTRTVRDGGAIDRVWCHCGQWSRPGSDCSPDRSVERGSDLPVTPRRRRRFAEHFRWRFVTLLERHGHRTATPIESPHSPEAAECGDSIGGSWLWPDRAVGVTNRRAARAAESVMFY